MYAGAMENWGLITYREARVLVAPDSAAAAKESAALVVGHEMAHMWFGNLVTMVNVPLALSSFFLPAPRLDYHSHNLSFFISMLRTAYNELILDKNSDSDSNMLKP